MVAFAGYELPLEFSGVRNEHRAVREAAGIFDVSHMGIFSLSGSQIYEYLQYVLTSDLDKYAHGMVFYSLMCNEDGGIVDDVFVYAVNKKEYLLIVNATNIEKDYNWLLRHSSCFDVDIRNLSLQHSIIALQGPKSDDILSEICGFIIKMHRVA